MRRGKPIARGTKRLARRSSFGGWGYARRASPVKHSRKWLVKALDSKVSRIVRAQEPTCVTCGEDDPEELECSHLFGRAHKATRYDTAPDGNNHTQCKLCNQRKKKPLQAFVDWYKGRFGEEAYEALERRAKSAIKWENDQLWKLLTEIRSPA